MGSVYKHPGTRVNTFLIWLCAAFIVWDLAFGILALVYGRWANVVIDFLLVPVMVGLVVWNIRIRRSKREEKRNDW